MWRWLCKTLLLCLLLTGLALERARATEYYGQVTFGGVPVPGARVTGKQGSKTVSALTDERGLFRFADLADGAWKVEIKLQLFATIHADVTVAGNGAAGNFELKALPLDDLTAISKNVLPQVIAIPKLQTPAENKPDKAANAPVDIPKPPEEANDQSADGLLVNGSVNNAATSQYSLNQAFGNRRPNSRSLY